MPARSTYLVLSRPRSLLVLSSAACTAFLSVLPLVYGKNTTPFIFLLSFVLIFAGMGFFLGFSLGFVCLFWSAPVAVVGEFSLFFWLLSLLFRNHVDLILILLLYLSCDPCSLLLNRGVSSLEQEVLRNTNNFYQRR